MFFIKKTPAAEAVGAVEVFGSLETFFQKGFEPSETKALSHIFHLSENTPDVEQFRDDDDDRDAGGGDRRADGTPEIDHQHI